MSQIWESELNTALVHEQEIGSLADSQASFFTMNNKCYIMEGTNYKVYDGETLSDVVPYIPTLSISKEPTGGGVAYEDFNLLGAGFKESFSADGTAKEFVLSLKNLDVTAVTAVVDNVNKAETTDFTVDRAAGKVTFTTAPAKGTNNVIITAYKTQIGFPERVKQCRFHTFYGGSNDTRVFISGNPNMPEYVWRSGLYDPTYFPENGFYKFPEKVTGFSKQYDYLVIHRAHGKHQITFELVNGQPSFPSKPINDQVGTLGFGSIQIIENNPVFLSNNGVYMLTASNVRDERNVQHISSNVDPKLLRESDLEQAVSIDFDKKYWITVNGNVYLFDYGIGEWFLYDNIHASCFLEYKGYLYFGDSRKGMVYRFRKETDSRPYNDDELPINDYWKSKHFTFGADERNKIVEKVFYSLKPNTRTSVDVLYASNKKQSDLIKISRMDLLDFTDMDFNYFTFLTNEFPQESTAKIKAKKITHFQLVMKNGKLDESLGLLSVGVKYKYQSYIK